MSPLDDSTSWRTGRRGRGGGGIKVVQPLIADYFKYAFDGPLTSLDCALCRAICATIRLSIKNSSSSVLGAQDLLGHACLAARVSLEQESSSSMGAFIKSR